jgi:hypothetical protein
MDFDFKNCLLLAPSIGGRKKNATNRMTGFMYTYHGGEGGALLPPPAGVLLGSLYSSPLVARFNQFERIW